MIFNYPKYYYDFNPKYNPLYYDYENLKITFGLKYYII
jgi:hypothetical protein